LGFYFPQRLLRSPIYTCGSSVCQPNDHGGPGIHDLEVKNTALLGKWLFKLLTEDGVWQSLLKNMMAFAFFGCFGEILLPIWIIFY
jgi:hypothetical protein